MKRFRNSISSPLDNENGSVIIIAIFILALLTIIGVAATNTSTLDLQIASNDQFIKMAFYNSDGAVWGTSKLISQAVNRSAKITGGAGNEAPGITYLPTTAANADQDFYEQIAGFEVYDSGLDLDFNPGGIDAVSDARRVRTAHVAGGGAEFATGSEGVGASAIAIYYDITASGFSNRQTTSNLTAGYRKMVGIPGGL